MANNLREIGLKVGLELHQQLDTQRKLFCSCSPRIRDDVFHGGFIRRLRPTQSELGEVDPAALFEFQKQKQFYYEYYNDTTCLVEADEEPPHEIDQQSIRICLTMAQFLASHVVDEIHPMRKIVIDGSNTTGFQRTAIIATGGSIEIDGKMIGIQTICLEEDAARKMGDDEKRNVRTYRLDRLGIPLIEIATAPDIDTPELAQETALRIGLLLRSTGRVKRGLGTIRQDVNVSITGGAIIEIKGLQKLDMLSTVVEMEAIRQRKLLEISSLLKERKINEERISDEPIDVTEVFSATKSKFMKKVIASGGRVFAARLLGFHGILGMEIQPGRRLGTELSDYAKFWGGVGGIFHTDELPAYGISNEEVMELRSTLNASDSDAIVLVAAQTEQCIDALKAVIERARIATKGVPPETRTPLPDGTTKYARPRPGSERMYPETDVRPVKITQSTLMEIRKNMPETPEAKKKRYIVELGLSEELADQMVRSLDMSLFEQLAADTRVSPTFVASTLLNTMVFLQRNGVEVENLDEDKIMLVLKGLAENDYAPDAVPELLGYFAVNPSASLEDALNDMDLSRIDTLELNRIIESVINEKRDFIRKQGEDSIGGLMGIVMKELRGRVDGKKAKELLLMEISRVLTEDGNE